MTSFRLLADVNDTFWFPKSASSFSSEVDWTYDMVMWICVIFMVPIAFFLFYFAWKYKKKKGMPAESQTSHNTVLEVAWSVLPCFLLVAIFAKGSIGFIDQRKAPEGAAEVGVSAYMWGWTMNYGNGIMHPELHLVVNQPTKLTMRSDKVLHSLFVPAFRAKRDIVPGRYNELWFEPNVAAEKVSDEELAKSLKDTEVNYKGVFDPERYQHTVDGYRYFDLYCAEYCGRDHSRMKSFVVVHKSQEDFDAWKKKYSGRRPEQTQEEYGKTLFNQRGCASCHSIDGTKKVGPSFQGLYGSEHALTDGSNVKVDAGYVRESILEPKAKIVAGYSPVMPAFKGQLSDDDIDSLIAYIKTMGISPAPTPATGSAPAGGTAAATGSAPAETAPAAEAAK